MGAVFDRLLIGLPETKNYLRVEHTEDDALISDLIDVAKEQIDAFLQNDFIDTEGNAIGIPLSIKIAAFKMVASWYEARRDDVTNENAGGHSVAVGEIPYDSKKMLFKFKKLVGT